MKNNYSDTQRVDIAKEEYSSYKVGQKVKVDGQIVGYVAKVVDNTETGEQAYIITDGNPKKQKPSEVKQVTVLYRGSTAPSLSNSWEQHKDSKNDWVDNDGPMANKIINNQKGVTAQLKSASKTLDSQMEKYENAQFDIYGHSLGSMNGQYAIANCKYPGRIHSAYLYEGPNIYGTLSKQQQAQADKLRNRIFNYVDEKDKVPIGYNKRAMGIVVFVDSKKADGMIDQHMWGGYQFGPNGELLYPAGKMIAVRTAQTEIFISDELAKVNDLEKKLQVSGGGLSAAEQVYLDSESTLAVANGVYQLVMQGVQDLVTTYKKELKSIESLWPKAIKTAQNIGEHLSHSEVIEALSAGGCTKATIIDAPLEKIDKKIKKIQEIGKKYEELVNQIRAGIAQQVASDKDLANQLESN